MSAEAETYGNGSGKMRVLLATCGARGDVEPMAGLAPPLWALGAVAAATEGCDAPAAGGVMPTGVWL